MFMPGHHSYIFNIAVPPFEDHLQFKIMLFLAEQVALKCRDHYTFVHQYLRMYILAKY